MNKVYADSTITISTGDFEKPEGVEELDMDCFNRRGGGNIYEESQEAPNWEDY